MQPSNTPVTNEHADNYTKNHEAVLKAISSTTPRTPADGTLRLTMRLARVLVDQERMEPVPFDGPAGIEAMLEQINVQWPMFSKIYHEERLMGLKGDLLFADGHRVALRLSLGAGGQVVCAVGPTTSVVDILGVIEVFDREVHLAAETLGRSYELVAEGYNPFVSSPLDVSLVPRTRWTLLTAHLSQTGRYARDAMRCGCATELRLYRGGTSRSVDAYKLAAALSPLLLFLTDNVRSFRGAGARRSPRMAHAIMWDEVDPARCGIVPGTFDSDFTFDTYLRWLEGTQTILFSSDGGTTVSTGKATTRSLMEERVLSKSEASQLLRTVHPHARLLAGCVELTQADSMRPRMAAGYASFIKGLFCNNHSLSAALSLLTPASDWDVRKATDALIHFGWDAEVYGQNVGILVDKLMRISRSSLTDKTELQLLNVLNELWEVRMVPRDAFVHQEAKQSRGW